MVNMVTRAYKPTPLLRFLCSHFFRFLSQKWERGNKRKDDVLLFDFTVLEKSVIQGDDPPKRNPIETLMWYAIQGLYAMYHSGQIDRERAKKHKTALTALYKTATDTYAAYVAAEKAYNTNISKAGHLRAEMVKAPDERTALLKALQIISAMTGETEIERIVKNAIENQSQMPGTPRSGKAAPAGDTTEKHHTP